VKGLSHDRIDVSDFHDPTGIHDSNPVTKLVGYSQVVSDKDHAGTALSVDLL
jgi:hypothetical protein